MKNECCSGEPVDVAEGRLLLNDLPDEILILIFNRLFDLKCLCSCSLVSPRFSSLILLHVHSVSFSVPRRTPNPIPIPIPANNTSTAQKFLRFFVDGIVAKPLHFFRQFVLAPSKPLPAMISSFYGDSFRSAVYFLSKFKSIRSLHFIFPSSPHNCNPNDDSLFRWTAKFGPTIDTFVFFSPSSIRVGRDSDFDDQEPEDSHLTNELVKHRVRLAFQCLKDAIVRHRMLLFFIEKHPLLQNITITDSDNQGSLSLRDSKLVELRNWINSSSLAVKSELKRIEVPVNAQRWHVPVLNLPVSGKVMESATLVLMEMVDRHHLHRDWGGDAAAIAHLFEQGDEACSEAIVEIMVNHNSRILL